MVAHWFECHLDSFIILLCVIYTSHIVKIITITIDISYRLEHGQPYLAKSLTLLLLLLNIKFKISEFSENGTLPTKIKQIFPND